MYNVRSSSSLAYAAMMTAENSNQVSISSESSRALHNDTYLNKWIGEARKNASLSTMLVPLNDVDGWNTDRDAGNLSHKTGRFFSVIGIHCRHRIGHHEIEWDQPIIEQPETGILGILVKQIDGVLHFCLQAKEEPGNIGPIQLSPTVQATYSNYTGAHGGSTPLFLEHFINTPSEQIVFARMQSEDGGRFLYKSNRNMIVKVGDEFPVQLPDRFIWLTLKQISLLLRQDNLVNACVRSILSGIILASQQNIPLHPGCQEGLRRMLQWFDDRKAANHMLAKRIGLNELKEWKLDAKGFFSHHENRFFRVVGLKVSSGVREINNWGQPIIENPAAGIIGLLLRNTTGGTELLMQSKAEVGNRNTVQLGPTVQFTQGNYEGSRKLIKPFLYDEFKDADSFIPIHESRQTEEGARFYREYNLHRILLLPDGTDMVLPHDYRWLSLDQVVFMLNLGEQVNSCARSVLACLL